jgi:aminoglycoside 6'-N-acetyltransferase I
MVKGRTVRIRQVGQSDIPHWLQMRRALWPDCPLRDQRREMEESVADTNAQPAWVAEAADGELAGFLEASVRNYAEGAGRTDLGYLEGWYVKPKFRKRGIGRALVKAAEEWAARRGFRYMASDTDLKNLTSIKAHLAMGYREVDRNVHYLKKLYRAKADKA